MTRRPLPLVVANLRAKKSDLDYNYQPSKHPQYNLINGHDHQHMMQHQLQADSSHTRTGGVALRIPSRKYAIRTSRSEATSQPT